MSEETNFTIRLSKAAKEFNVGVTTIREFLGKKGFQVDSSPNAKLTSDMYELLVKEYQGEKEVKNVAKNLGNISYKGGTVSVDSALQPQKNEKEEDHEEVIIRSNTIVPPKKAKEPEKTVEEAEKPAEPKTETPAETPVEDSPIKILGKIDLESLNQKTHPDKKPKERPKKSKKKLQNRSPNRRKTSRHSPNPRETSPK